MEQNEGKIGKNWYFELAPKRWSMALFVPIFLPFYLGIREVE